MKKDSIFTNSFEEAYKEFQSSELSAKLSQKFSPKPYHKKFKKLKRLAGISSILCAALSALTALSFVFLICLSMNVGWIAALIIAAVALSALEYCKRLTIEPMILDYFKFRIYRWGLALMFCALSALSVYSSFQGSKLAVNELNKEIALIDTDSVQNHFNGKIGAIEAKIKNYQTNPEYRNSDGIILYKVSANLIPGLERERGELERRAAQALISANGENETRTTEHKARNAQKGVNLGYVTILCEALLLLSLSYSNYYDYRSFVEMVAVENTVYTAKPDGDILELAARKLDADIISYQHKIKNKIGKPETAKKRIAELTAKKAKIEAQITT